MKFSKFKKEILKCDCDCHNVGNTWHIHCFSSCACGLTDFQFRNFDRTIIGDFDEKIIVFAPFPHRQGKWERIKSYWRNGFFSPWNCFWWIPKFLRRKVRFPFIKDRLYPPLLAEELISVQSMTGTGSLFTIERKWS